MGEECLLPVSSVSRVLNTPQEQLIDVFKSVGSFSTGKLENLEVTVFVNSLVHQIHLLSFQFDRSLTHPTFLFRPVPIDAYLCTHQKYSLCFARVLLLSVSPDHETALSAVRNLNNVDVGGRPLRIDLADSDPFLEGKTTVRGELLDGSDPRGHWRDRNRDKDRDRDRDRDRDHYDLQRDQKPQGPSAFLSSLPPGVPVPLGSTALDCISQTLGTMNPAQLVEVLAQMKAFVITHPEQARALLVAHPQYAYALFQALLLNKIVDQAVLQRMLQATVGSSAPSGPPQPPLPQLPTYQQPPTLHPTPPVLQPQLSVPPLVTGPSMYQQPPHMPQHAYYRPPPPPQPAPPAQAPPSSVPDLNIDPAQRQMLFQVLSLTQDQINGLPPTERDAIQALRNQFMGGITA
ncbi:hinge domain of cleavage stimulation factor subunit 2-domain-containing protein [Boletus reticuloceps]|uniref:Hinge domain of cleavage stimulation factor subunit 2-domain-containing protein n=1 Tax=Boletus reticuloceps TaxID=495285 RepID=A0A8I2YX92_9AGAM|nr:hinge domain of cleavage stimulation factor subunit 2-domain-containing protein [Boletus reticuloceps]